MVPKKKKSLLELDSDPMSAVAATSDSGAGLTQPAPALQDPPTAEEPPAAVTTVGDGIPEAESAWVDVAESVARGAEEATHDFYGLLDTITFNALPDWDEKRLFRDTFGFGEAEGTAASLVQGVSQFLTGFLMTGGMGSAAGGIKVLGGAVKAGQALKSGTMAGKLMAASGKGMFVDFAFFDAHEQRLSNLIQNTPLANPITDFLAADEDDGEISGRLKNVLEGVGLGVLTDTIITGLKKMKAGKKVRDTNPNATPQQVSEAMDAVEGPTAVKDKLDALRSEDSVHPTISPEDADLVAEDIGLVGSRAEVEQTKRLKVASSDKTVKMTILSSDDAKAGKAAVAGQSSQTVGAPSGPLEYTFESDAGVASTTSAGGASIEQLAEMRATADADAKAAAKAAKDEAKAAADAKAAEDLFENLGPSVRDGQSIKPMNEMEAAQFADDVLNKFEESGADGLRYNPRDPKFDAQRLGTIKDLDDKIIPRNGLNLSMYEGSDGSIVATRAVEHRFEKEIARSYGDRDYVSHVRLARHGLNTLADMFNLSRGEREALFHNSLRSLGNDRNSLIKISARFQAHRAIMQERAHSLFNEIDTLANGSSESLENVADATLAHLVLSVREHARFVRGIKGVSAEWGRGLAGHKIAVRPMRKLGSFDDLSKELERAIEKRKADAVERLRPETELSEEAALEKAAKIDADAELGAARKQRADEIKQANAEYKQARNAAENAEKEARIAKEKAERIASNELKAKAAEAEKAAKQAKKEADKLEKKAKELEEADRTHNEREDAKAKKFNERKAALDSIKDKKTTRTMEEDTAVLDEVGGRKAVVKFLRQMHAAMKDPSARAAGFANTATLIGDANKSLWSMNMTYWINALLSAPLTHAVNVTSNTFVSVYRPLENMVGAGLKLDTTELYRAAKELQTVGRLYVDTLSLWKHSEIRDAAKESFRTGRSVLFSTDHARSAGALTGRIEGDEAVFTAGNISQAASRSILGSLFAPAKWANRATKGDLGRLFDATADPVLRTPTNALQASDELFKQVNYRASVIADLSVEAREAGLRGVEADQYVSEQFARLVKDKQAYSMKNLYDEGKAEARTSLSPDLAHDEDAIHEYASKYVEANHTTALQNISDKAIGRAEEATFTEPLSGNHPMDAVGSSLRKLGQKVPVTRIFWPFIIVPTNILKFADRRIGFDPIIGAIQYAMPSIRNMGAVGAEKRYSLLLKDLLSNDPTRVAAAKGRIAFGMATATTIGMLAANQFDDDAPVAITGRGPGDPNERAAWRDLGHQEYSLRIHGKYYSYQRIEPFASMMGLVADIAQYSHFNQSDEELSSYMWATMASISANFTNKTYTQGVSDLVELSKADANVAENWFNKFAGSYVPSAAAAMARAQDPELKEIRGVLDAAMARVPHWSGNIAVQRNAIGEPRNRPQAAGSTVAGRWMNAWMPVTTSEAKDDPVLREMVNTQHAWRPPTGKLTIGGISVDLSQFKNKSGQLAADRVEELTGSLSIGGRTLRQSLTLAVNNPAYQRLPEWNRDDSLPNMRAKILGNIISSYRWAAKTQMLKEYPEITGHLEEKGAQLKRSVLQFPGSNEPVRSN